MTVITVRAPQPVTTTIVGIPFAHGEAKVDDSNPRHRRALAYFRRHGYSVASAVADPATPAEKPKTPAFEPPPGAPGRNASKHDWVIFAANDAPEGLRLTAEQAEALTRDQLAEKYLGPKED